MRIAIDITPIDSQSNSSHKVRGVGKYITLLKDNLERFDKKNTYVFSSKPQRENADIIHYPYFDPFFLTLPFKNKRPTLVTVHDVIPLTHKKHFPTGLIGQIKWNVNKILLRKVNVIITDSQASKDDISKVTGIQGKKISPVHLSVDEDFKKLSLDQSEITNLRKKYDLPDKFVLYVGDVTWNKNLPMLVNAVKSANVPLVMIGSALVETDFDETNSWNNSRKEVLSLISDDPKFVKLGFVPTNDLVKIYNQAKALLMPSFDEGFGLPILEAMKSGCPVITSRNGSLPEVAGDAAVYVDNLNIENLSDAIKKVVSDNSIYETLSKKGLIHAENFSLEKMIKDTVKVYESVNPNAEKN